MPASTSEQAARSPADRAADGAEPSRPPRLPNEIWQQIARAALAAEDGDMRAWARLSAVNSLWRAAVSCAVMSPDAVPEVGPVPGDQQLLCIAVYNNIREPCCSDSRRLVNAMMIERHLRSRLQFDRGA